MNWISALIVLGIILGVIVTLLETRRMVSNSEIGSERK